MLAERIREIIESVAINIGETSLHITASFGVASVEEADVSLDSVYKRADSALYEAKNAGRNCVRRK